MGLAFPGSNTPTFGPGTGGPVPFPSFGGPVTLPGGFGKSGAFGGGGGDDFFPTAGPNASIDDLVRAFSQQSGILGRDAFDISRGIDPLFDQLRSNTLATTSEFFGRRGTGGSTASLNALSRAGSGVDLLGLQRSDQARGQAAELLGAGPAALIALLAARNAGEGGGGDDLFGSFGDFGQDVLDFANPTSEDFFGGFPGGALPGIDFGGGGFGRLRQQVQELRNGS